jgi:hypothetical protein
VHAHAGFPCACARSIDEMTAGRGGGAWRLSWARLCHHLRLRRSIYSAPCNVTPTLPARHVSPVPSPAAVQQDDDEAVEIMHVYGGCGYVRSLFTRAPSDEPRESAAPPGEARNSLGPVNPSSSDMHAVGNSAG